MAIALLCLTLCPVASGERPVTPLPGATPIIRDRFTADPATLVVGDTLYLFTFHDEAQRDDMFNIREWLVYSTKDMRIWTERSEAKGLKRCCQQGSLALCRKMPHT